MSGKSAGGTLGNRLLIIAFGAAIVVLGLYPNGKRISNLFDYIKNESTAYAKGLRSAPTRGRIDQPRVRRLSSPTRNDRARARLAPKAQQKPMDELRKADRAQLNNLLEDL